MDLDYRKVSYDDCSLWRGSGNHSEHLYDREREWTNAGHISNGLVYHYSHSSILLGLPCALDLHHVPRCYRASNRDLPLDLGVDTCHSPVCTDVGGADGWFASACFAAHRPKGSSTGMGTGCDVALHWRASVPDRDLSRGCLCH